MRPDLLAILRCPTCGSSLTLDDRLPDCAIALVCPSCGTQAPIRGGIPRFVDAPEDESARRTQASFGYEWTHFNDWQPSGETNFNDYFQGIDLASLRGRLVLDAGCGMGRHARQIARFADRVVALDFSRAIEQAARNTAAVNANVDCVQADLLRLPLADDTFDFVYSLGVLHHLEQTERALRGLVARVRPGGRMRVYLYWKRHGWSAALLSLATAARRVTTRLPFPILRVLCWLLSIVLFAGAVLPYRALAAVGVRRIERWPLFIYAKYPFRVLYNDQFDRFSAPIEKRYDPDEVRALLESAGLVEVRIWPCFGWIAEGRKPLAV
jgi:SAM-dependent methyltransferase